ncbi:hypothetical protein, partial [Methylacidimicrobium tartarophylax]|uniref:hypothetical protein n=1 Tax=Methylacidimicrobium tartarophylax TaxID=1041768 RepID=UPI0024824622
MENQAQRSRRAYFASCRRKLVKNGGYTPHISTEAWLPNPIRIQKNEWIGPKPAAQTFQKDLKQLSCCAG